MKKVYIAGKITGEPNYKEIFEETENILEKNGFIVLNPARSNFNLKFSHAEIMHICYAMIDICDTVFFLDNWEFSRGAVMEYEYAINNNKTILYNKS